MAGASGAGGARAARTRSEVTGSPVILRARSQSVSGPYSVPGMGEKVPLGHALEMYRDAPVAFRRLALLEPGA